MIRIKFKGKDFLFAGDSLDEDGAITTDHNFSHGLVSYAHWFPDENAVKRFQNVIGTREDIEVIDAKVPTPEVADDFMAGMSDPEWDVPGRMVGGAFPVFAPGKKGPG